MVFRVSHVDVGGWDTLRTSQRRDAAEVAARKGNRLGAERLGTSPSRSLRGKARRRDVSIGAMPIGQHRGGQPPDDSLRLSAQRTVTTGLEPRVDGALSPNVNLLSGQESFEEMVGGSFVDSLTGMGPGYPCCVREIDA
jgi:hypothetical protein